MIIKARHHAFIYPFFQWYSRRIIKRHFDQVIIHGEFNNCNQPVLLVSNHTSWWDGFWAMYLNLELFKRKFHFMMLKSQLHKYWYFNFSGGYSVEQKSRSALESIDYTVELLSQSDNLVLMFPQGKLQSMHRQNFEFQKGIERIVEKAGRNNIQLVFLVNITEYLSKQRPALHQYVMEYTGSSSSVDEIQLHYNDFCRQCFEQHYKMEE
jgi:1-acyl-sn-glycerol-3-phosphate acyltransferase